MTNLLKKTSILFEDDFILIFDKPSGLLTIPDRFDQEVPSVLQYLVERTKQKVFPVHRIDKDTSGLLCFAKDKESHAHISQQFEKRTVKKTYFALVLGNVEQANGIIEEKIGPDNSRAGRMKIDSDGKTATTKFELIEHIDKYSSLSVQILTGRTHQIRLHLKHIGHPLAVDPFYGSSRGIFLSDVKAKYNQSKHKTERPMIGRLTLHATNLTIKHPNSNKDIEFVSELPKDLAVSIKLLKKYGKTTDTLQN